MKSSLRFALPFVVLLWSSCSGDEVAPVVEKPVCLLMEQTSVVTYNFVLNPDVQLKPQTITTRLEYNDRNALATIFQTEYAGLYFDRADLKYNKKGQVTEVVQKYNRYVNEYNGQGKLAKQTRYNTRIGDFKEVELGYYTLTYNSRQELNEVQQFSMVSGAPVPELVWRYTYVNGDPVYLEHSEPGGQSYYHVKMTYDTLSLPSIPYAHTYFEPWRPPSVHNQLSYAVQETNPSYESYSTTYTYNERGYPVTANTRFSSGMEQTVTYTYVCK